MFERGQRYIGIKEMVGKDDHPLILWWLSLCGLQSPVHDETAWCSAYVNGVAWDEGLPRSMSASARSWLRVGREIALADAIVGNDVVILKRGKEPQPGPEVIHAPGHVGIYAGPRRILGGNQSDMVGIGPFDPARVLGVRRIA